MAQEPHFASPWRRASVAGRAEQAWGLGRSRACCGGTPLSGQEAGVHEKQETVKALAAQMVLIPLAKTLKGKHTPSKVSSYECPEALQGLTYTTGTAGGSNLGQVLSCM